MRAGLNALGKEEQHHGVHEGAYDGKEEDVGEEALVDGEHDGRQYEHGAPLLHKSTTTRHSCLGSPHRPAAQTPPRVSALRS